MSAEPTWYIARYTDGTQEVVKATGYDAAEAEGFMRAGGRALHYVGHYVPVSDPPVKPKKHWSLLPNPHGFHRVPDSPTGRRMLSCDVCGHVLPSLGVGYHNQGGIKCRARAVEREA